MWVKLLLAAGLMWIFQGVLTYFQIKDLQVKLKKMKEKGIVGIGTVKNRFGSGAIVILSVDETGRIIEAQKMTGVSVFARFRHLPELKGLHYWEAPGAIDESNKVLLKAVAAASDFLSKKMKADCSVMTETFF
ncbi:MAG: transcriptional regulator GutM [Tepidanaerobacteraceae bacterium]|jgi:glucitol operon activator protein|nr:transcriptional regulator GutM [Tepidanaerobacteraceae bacterium]